MISVTHLVAVGKLVAKHDDVVHLPDQAEVLREILLGHLEKVAADGASTTNA